MQESKLAGSVASDVALLLLQGVSRSSSFLGVRPSTVAAAALYCTRKARGLLPLWPSALAELTGQQGVGSGELALCVAGMQLLLRTASATGSGGSARPL